MSNAERKSQHVPPDQWALRSPVAIVVLAVVIALGAASDLWSKHAVFRDLLAIEDLSDRVTWAKADLATQYNISESDSPDYSTTVLQMVRLNRPLCCGADVTLSVNPGVVFGFNWLPRWVVNALTGLAMLLALGFFATSHRRNYWLHAALGLILGGAIGNLHDRLFSEVALPGVTPIRGHVRDFLDFSAWGYPYVFNLADVWLVVGVGMIIAYWLYTGWKERKADKAASQT